MVLAKVWVVKKEVVGEPKLENFYCKEEELGDLSNGDILIAAEFLSVDPYMRYMIRSCPLDTAIVGSQVARVIESKNAAYPVDSYLVCRPGWRSHTLVTKKQLEDNVSYAHLPDLGDHSKSLALGILGMPGNTAYFGFLEICTPKAGDTVLVNAAAGAVGSAVAQIAKIKGCKVVAFAGSTEKVSWLQSVGIDHVYNYKTSDISKAIKEAAPDGINCYFDNVGGELTAKVLPHMAEYGRVSVCGAISTYNEENKALGMMPLTSPFSESLLIWKQLRVEGFIVTSRWLNRWNEGIMQMKQWIDQGKVKYKETFTEGFENMPTAFIGLFTGSNFGKAIVKV